MKRILVVEDEPLVRQLALDDLSDAGFTVIPACSGDEALALLENGATIDALFTDIRMPGAIDGWELGRRARQRQPDLRVVYTTGYSEGVRSLDGGESLLLKPYHIEDLLSRLNS